MFIRLIKVASNMRLSAIVLCLTMGVYSAASLAQTPSLLSQRVDQNVEQEADQKTPAKTSKGEPEARQKPVTDTSANSGSQTPILRLEDTIRANKEQPQVLTIVPWQLPVHQRINENTEWQHKVSQLSPIERNAFLRKLALVKQMKAVQEADKPASSNSEYE